MWVVNFHQNECSKCSLNSHVLIVLLCKFVPQLRELQEKYNECMDMLHEAQALSRQKHRDSAPSIGSFGSMNVLNPLPVFPAVSSFHVHYLCRKKSVNQSNQLSFELHQWFSNYGPWLPGNTLGLPDFCYPVQISKGIPLDQRYTRLNIPYTKNFLHVRA